MEIYILIWAWRSWEGEAIRVLFRKQNLNSFFPVSMEQRSDTDGRDLGDTQGTRLLTIEAGATDSAVLCPGKNKPPQERE